MLVGVHYLWLQDGAYAKGLSPHSPKVYISNYLFTEYIGLQLY